MLRANYYLQNFSFVISLSPKATNTMQSRIPLINVLKGPFCFYAIIVSRETELVT